MCQQPVLLENAIAALCAWEHDRAVVIVIRGQLDASTRQVVHDGFASFAGGSCRRVVVDASEVTFIDCSGWGGLLAAAHDVGCEVWLRSPSRPVRRLLQLIQVPAAGHRLGPSDEMRLA